MADFVLRMHLFLISLFIHTVEHFKDIKGVKSVLITPPTSTHLPKSKLELTFSHSVLQQTSLILLSCIFCSHKIAALARDRDHALFLRASLTALNTGPGMIGA